MLEPHELAEAFGRNLGVLQAQAEGLTHTDSLLQLPFRGNCLNWILGHLLDNRDVVLEALLDQLAQSQERLARALGRATDADMAREVVAQRRPHSASGCSSSTSTRPIM